MSRCDLPRRVLVLGGTGFLGAEIVRLFLDAGSEVTAVARSAPDPSSAKRIEGAHLVQGSVSDGQLVGALVRRSDHVVHAVGCPFPAESNLDPVGDLLATMPALLQVLDAVGSASGVGFSFLSSGGTVYGNPATCPVAETHPCDPITPYGITKLTAEKYIGLYAKRMGIPARVLRVANAYGARQSAARGQGLVAAALDAAVSGGAITLYGDGVVRDYVDARDVAKSVVDLAGRSEGPAVVNVGSGRGYSVAEVIEVVGRIAGRPLNVRRAMPRPFDVGKIVLDVSTLRSLVPWDPRDLAQGIQDAWSAKLEDGQPASGVLS